MKKTKWLTLLLCLILALQCIALPVCATAVGETEETLPPAGPDETISPDQKAAFGTVSIQNGCRTINGMVPLGGVDKLVDTAQAVFLYETTTDTVVYSYNPDIKLAPGNLAKMVTALIALEMCDVNEIVTVNSTNISKLPAGSINQKLKHDEKLTVGDLVHCMLLVSANDAAIALAEHISGTQQAFTTLMNDRAARMGCTTTKFANVHGLENNDAYTTARDMAKITRECIKNETFAKIFREPKYTVPKTERSDERTFATLNYMIDQSIIPDFYDNKVTGGITHFHPSSGAHLICTKEYKNMNYIAVVMGCARTYAENGWSVKSYGNFNEMTDLLRYGFEKFKINHILYEGMSLKPFPVSGGESNAVGESIVNYNSVVPINASMDNLNMKYAIAGGGLVAPVAKGEMIGTLEIWYRNSCMAEAEIFSMGDVKATERTGVDIHSNAVRSDADDSGILSVIGTICVIVLGLAVAYLAFNAYMRSRIRAQRRRRREARRRNY